MISSFLFILLPLFFGYCFSIKKQPILAIIQNLSSTLVHLILFFMGITLALIENMQSYIKDILLITSVFSITIGVCSIIGLVLLDRYTMKSIELPKSKTSPPIYKMILESLKLIIYVLLGFIVGWFITIPSLWVDKASEYTLFFLLFLIGIQLRNSGLSLREIIINKSGISIAFIILAMSLLSGVLSAWILDIPMNYGLALASGFGWYSLSGILITEHLGPIYGSAAFLTELLRELLALILIPLVIQRFPQTAIGYAGATALDFTLPVIQHHGGIRCVPIAIVSGFLLSLCVPVLILFFLSL